jgi:acetoin utilization protein AcuB
VQFGFLLEDRPGSIKEVTDIIRKYHARLVSIMTTYSKAPHGHTYTCIRAFNVNRETLPQLKKELSEKAKLLHMVDLREGTREMYATK